LHRGEGGHDRTNGQAARVEIPAINREQRQDDPKTNQVNENRKEDDQNGRFSHERQLNRDDSDWAWILNDINRVYLRKPASQGGERASSPRGGLRAATGFGSARIGSFLVACLKG
jgi:hypothetical protein